MKAIFSVLGLLIVLGIVGVLAKKQLTTAVPQSLPNARAAASGQGAQPVTPQQQINQMKQGLEQTLQQPRPVPGDEEKK